jgi:hypothetical protein
MLAHAYLFVTAAIVSKPWRRPASVTLGEVRRLVAHRITAVPSRAVS